MSAGDNLRAEAMDLFGEPYGTAPARYPDVPGHRRRATSRAAADAIAPRAIKLRDLVLAEIKRKSGTADEIAARLRQTVLATRPRVTELAKLSLIEDAGIRRSNISGRSAIVWRAAP